MDLFLSFNDDAGLVADLGSGGGRPLRPGQYFSIFKMLDGRTPRGSPSRETIFYPSIVYRYIRAYIVYIIYRRIPLNVNLFFTKP